MPQQISEETHIQRRYYQETAGQYDDMHVNDKDEHFFALSLLLSALDHFEIQSVLDIGSGTGRALRYIRQRRPDVQLAGVEPVKELREIGHRHGLSETELVDGDATRLLFDDREFDLVCEFGVLHHLKTPDVAVAEMLRTAKKVIFISDSNNFGQGSFVNRSIKQLLNVLGLWKVTDLIKTRGRGYTLSAGDGLAYSYSVFNNYHQISEACSRVHILNTVGNGINPYRSAGHIALLGIKREYSSRR